MNKQKYLKDYFSNLREIINFDDDKIQNLIKVSEILINADKNGNKTLIFGNGGSAAMASHVAVDLTKAAGVRSVNFNEADLITCFANDYGYENVFEKALNFYGDRGDTLISISSSGMSKNILKAVSLANKKDIAVITFSGFDPSNSLRNLVCDWIFP